MKLKTKNPGISFALGIIVSTILLAVGITVFESVNRVAEQGWDLEAKNKLFYQNESGFEAALYHHNKLGGKGLSIGTQTIDLENGNEIEWEIIGRKISTSSPTILTGILKESETIEIPFYYDDRENPTDAEDIQQINGNFSLDFSRFEFNEDGNTSSSEIIPEIGTTNSHFNFADKDDTDTVFRNNVLISWAVTKKDTNGEIKTFVPRTDEINLSQQNVLCPNSLSLPDPELETKSSFFCEVSLNSGIDISIKSSDPVIGYILPGQTESTLSAFWTASGSNRKLSFRPLALYFNDIKQTGPSPHYKQKIKGIPWKVEVNNLEIPTPTFTIKTRSSVVGVNGKYSKTESVTLDEKTAISSFDSFNAE